VTPERSPQAAPLTSEMPRPAFGRPVGRSGNPIRDAQTQPTGEERFKSGQPRVLQLDPEARHRRAGRCGASVFCRVVVQAPQSFRYRVEVSQLR
jgi:hypothetical protein